MNDKVALATELLIALLTQATHISELLRQVKQEDRDISELEWEGILAENLDARTRLVEAIRTAREG